MEKQVKTKDGDCMKRMTIEVAANQLRSAPWNPREKITAASVADITASIKTVGLIEPLVMMKDPEKPSFKGQDFYVIIAGHRRYVVWQAANMVGTIRCELVDCDVETAKRMTMIENLQRKDLDPLMEANLIEGLVKGGMTIEAIAAETGRGEKWVWRRKQLSKLTSGWRNLIGKIEGKFTVDCLEKIARYDEKVQDIVYEEAKDDWSVKNSPTVEWGDLNHYFSSVSKDLGEAEFCTKDCEHCALNTATTPMLFEELEEKGKKRKKLGRCTNSACYDKKRQEWFEAEKAKVEKLYGKLKVVKSVYSLAPDYSQVKNKDYTTPIIEDGYAGKRILWIDTPRVAMKEDEEAKAQKKEQKKREQEKKEVEERACEKIRSWSESNLKEKIRNKLFSLDLDQRSVLTEYIYNRIMEDMSGYTALTVCATIYKTLIHDGVELSEKEGKLIEDTWNDERKFIEEAEEETDGETDEAGEGD